MANFRKINILAGATKLAASFVVPVAISSVTKAATNTIKPNAPKIDTRFGKIAFRLGETFLIGMLSTKAVNYIEDEVDDYVNMYKNGVNLAESVAHGIADARAEMFEARMNDETDDYENDSIIDNVEKIEEAEVIEDEDQS